MYPGLILDLCRGERTSHELPSVLQSTCRPSRCLYLHFSVSILHLDSLDAFYVVITLYSSKWVDPRTNQAPWRHGPSKLLWKNSNVLQKTPNNSERNWNRVHPRPLHPTSALDLANSKVYFKAIPEEWRLLIKQWRMFIGYVLMRWSGVHCLLAI